LPVKPVTQTNAIEQPSPQIYWLSTAELKIGVPQQALASWSVLLALAGYRYSAKEHSLSFMPAVNARDFQCFFAAGSGWGTFSQQLRNSSLEVPTRGPSWTSSIAAA
jgi:hypothetical protein